MKHLSIYIFILLFNIGNAHAASIRLTNNDDFNLSNAITWYSLANCRHYDNIEYNQNHVLSIITGGVGDIQFNGAPINLVHNENICITGHGDEDAIAGKNANQVANLLNRVFNFNADQAVQGYQGRTIYLLSCSTGLGFAQQLANITHTTVHAPNNVCIGDRNNAHIPARVLQGQFMPDGSYQTAAGANILRNDVNHRHPFQIQTQQSIAAGVTNDEGNLIIGNAAMIQNNNAFTNANFFYDNAAMINFYQGFINHFDELNYLQAEGQGIRVFQADN